MQQHALFALGLWLAGSSLALAAGSPAPAAAHADPLDSPRWQDMRREFFPDARVTFDPRVRVLGPVTAENPLNVPISVDASALPEVQEVVVFADFNPIVRILRFFPEAARPTLAFRIKLQQSSPVRAAARTADGVWHVGGTWVETTGGGCTLPSTGSADPEWQTRLNEVSGRLWAREDGGQRLRVRLIHPMDTGLAPGIPAFHLQTLQLRDGEGHPLMRIEPFEPVAENPLFTVDLPAGGKQVHISGRDNNGNAVDAWVRP